MTPDERIARIKKLRGQYAAITKHARNVKLKIETLIRECGHEDTHRTPDPSGGNDPAITCNICGKEW
jgi:hypothetical protein